MLSHSHEELDPSNDFHGWLAHQLAREWVNRAFPGRQAKIVTQRDNGRWEEVDGKRTWVDGKWHSHIMVANVAEQEVTLRWTDAEGVEKTRHYKAGRAIDGDLKNIFRLRRVTDAVIQREWQYDNAAYVEACRRFNEGAAAKQDYAQRAERGYSSYDEVRLKLRTAAAQATDWTDYVTRCQAAAVDVKTRGAGGTGVSYAWVGDDGLERKARARGKTGLGPEFARAEIEKRCEQNTAALARGEALEIPEQVLVVPSNTVAPDRPRPQYQTADGKPPWENAEALAEYEAKVRATGGTYEARAEQALVTGEPVEGVALLRQDDGVLAVVDAGDGQAVFDVDAALAQRVAEIEAAQAVADGRLGEAETAMNEAAVLRARADAALQAAEADRAAGLAEVEDLKRAAETAVEDGRKAGYDAGYTQGRTEGRRAEKEVYDLKTRRLADREAAAAKWETETEPALRAEIRSEIEDAMRDDRDAAAADRADARRRLEAIPEYDDEHWVDEMKRARLEAEYEVRTPVLGADGRAMEDADGKTVWTSAHQEIEKRARERYNRIKEEGKGQEDETVGQSREREAQTQSQGKDAWSTASSQGQSQSQSKRKYIGE
ncbi:hypothetical protein [Gordonia neofelifaecis]|uniref:hypothetical protein n=1 Tax=Gordonia neofelifaecis TaxID=945692 RepID=UPI00158523A5|nr:hypothetical protein [Gordonia neofelifaecis]